MKNSESSRSFITIASGSQFFFDMAMTLARSIALRGDLKLYVVSDQQFAIPRDVTNVHLIVDKWLPKGFRAKLYLDKYIVTEQTIFLDADCVLLKEPSALFDLFQGYPVGILGLEIFEGEWFGDVATICQRLSIPCMYRFNGGFYYLEKCELASQIYDWARQLSENYDEIGFVRLRGQPNEEVLVGCSLAKFGIKPLKNFGKYYADFQWWPKLKYLDVVAGKAVLSNYPRTHQRHQSRYPSEYAEPFVLHFLGQHAESHLYRKVAVCLKLKSNGYLAAGALANIATLPNVLSYHLKNMLRPAYRFAFGVRNVSSRTKRYLEKID